MSKDGKQYLDIKVHPVVYDFYVAQYGAEFEIDKDSLLLDILPHLLKLRPKEYPDTMFKHFKTLRLRVRNFRFGNNHDGGAKVNAQYRHYLSDRQQFYLSRYLTKEIKRIFHNYMLAYMMSNPVAKQKDGINDFCLVYMIEENALNYEMLKKSWDRSYEKKRWFAFRGTN